MGASVATALRNKDLMQLMLTYRTAHVRTYSADIGHCYTQAGTTEPAWHLQSILMKPELNASRTSTSQQAPSHETRTASKLRLRLPLGSASE